MENRILINAVLILAGALTILVIKLVNKDSFDTIPVEQGANTVDTVAETSTIIVDIRSDKFFWRLQPWKDGKLATLDGWARFSELSFEGAGKIKINSLVKFPDMQIGPLFTVWPEAELWFSQSARMDHVAYMETKFTKSFIPFMRGGYSEDMPFLLDKDEGLLAFVYYQNGWGESGRKYLLYNYKKDVLLDEPEDTEVRYEGFLDRDSLLASNLIHRNDSWFSEYFLYDWRTDKKTENELTKKLTELNMLRIYCTAVGNVNTQKRFLIAKSEALGGHVKINWDEGFKDVKVTPINFLLSKDKYYDVFTISSDGKWAHSLVGGYRGLYEERLYKNAFYHIDDRYPGGISPPVLMDYTEYHPPYGVFIEHQVHGMCYAIEHHKMENDTDQLYLRLYKMDEILKEINRQLLEMANKEMDGLGDK
ncbi:MAG: hypothetical protein LBH35_09970 [Treponema sp.]|nr:hypothetical protein [Treponema sp.]